MVSCGPQNLQQSGRPSAVRIPRMPALGRYRPRKGRDHRIPVVTLLRPHFGSHLMNSLRGPAARPGHLRPVDLTPTRRGALSLVAAGNRSPSPLLSRPEPRTALGVQGRTWGVGSGRLTPLRRDGDRVGCSLPKGEPRTPSRDAPARWPEPGPLPPRLPAFSRPGGRGRAQRERC